MEDKATSFLDIFVNSITKDNTKDNTDKSHKSQENKPKETRLPIPSYLVSDKKLDYKLLLNLIYLSNYNTREQDKDRYIYLNKINAHIDEILENCNISQIKTIKTKIKYMLDNEILEPIRDTEGNTIAYRVFTKHIEQQNGYILLEPTKILEVCQSLSNNEIKVYIAISRHFTHKRKAKTISRELIAQDTNLSTRTVSRALGTLKDKGYIELNKSNNNNSYDINLI